MKLSNAATTLVPLLFAATLPPVHGWGSQGHEIVATLAQIHLHPTTLHRLCNILHPDSPPPSLSLASQNPPCHLANVASWADQVRTQPKYTHTKTLHFVNALDDFPSRICVFPGPQGWERPNNIISAIRDMTTTLSNYTAGEETPTHPEEALKFLVHFLGDVHQPLHLSGREVGGNLVNVTFNGTLTRLHKVWDNDLIPQKINELSSNYSLPLPPHSTPINIESHFQGKSYDPYIRRLIYEGLGTAGRFTPQEQEEWLSCPNIHIPFPPQMPLGAHPPSSSSDWDDEILCPYAWAKTIQRLNCDFPTWPRELDEHLLESGAPRGPEVMGKYPLLELDTPEYTGRIKEEWIVEKLLAQGGIRLAGILNGIFADEGSEYLPRLSL